MFRAPLCPSAGAHDDSVGYQIGRLGECPDRRLQQPSVRTLFHPAFTQLSNQQQLEDQTAHVVTNAIVVSS